MKLNTRNAKAKKAMTLLELTVVILVLLSLISILFIGARAWKRGSDRAGCILNIRNVQQAVRSHANMKNLNVNTGTYDPSIGGDIIGPDKFLEDMPECPGGGSYTALSGTVPSIGTLATTCSLAGSLDHEPDTYTDW